MKYYEKEVDLRSKKDMLRFLQEHLKYNTMNSWNQSLGWAHNVKIHKLGLTATQRDQAYALLEVWDSFNWQIQTDIDDFTKDTKYRYTIGFNGRSGGYLVLYKCEQKVTGYKSECLDCRQLCYKSEEDAHHCGKCGGELENFKTPHMQLAIFPGKSTIDVTGDDADEDIKNIRDEVKLVISFDKACDRIRDTFIAIIDSHGVEEKVISVPKKITVLVKNDNQK